MEQIEEDLSLLGCRTEHLGESLRLSSVDDQGEDLLGDFAQRSELRLIQLREHIACDLEVEVATIAQVLDELLAPSCLGKEGELELLEVTPDQRCLDRFRPEQFADVDPYDVTLLDSLEVWVVELESPRVDVLGSSGTIEGKVSSLSE